ncbi:MAG: FISUMP domain-containing protein [Bacteroidales bacterium]
MKHLIAILIGLAGFSLSIVAQSPAFFNYQAVARQADGSLLASRTIGLEITIREGSDKGTVLYSERHEVMTDEFGLVTIAVGDGWSEQEFSAINWGAGGDKWLEVKLDAENNGFYVLMGATQLLSVPFAMYAREAGNASNSLPLLTENERDALVNPPNGMMIINTTTNAINVHRSGDWWEVPLTIVSGEWSCGKTFVDSRDDRRYKTTQIGSKCWMAENLNVGQAVNMTAGQANNGTIEKYCYNNDVQLCNTYGGLYSWNEAMDYTTIKGSRGICPEGWHIPTDQEWIDMEMALGMSESEAYRANVWRGTDQGTQLGPGGSSGYNALYSGRSVPGVGFTLLGTWEYVWTSNESGANAWRRCLSNTDPKVGRYDSFPKSYGMSVRCIR